MSVCVYVCLCVSYSGSLFPLSITVSGDQIQVIKFAQQKLCPLSHLVGHRKLS